MKRFVPMLLALCLLLSGCGSKVEERPEEKQSLLLGFSQLGWESAWRLANTESIKSAAEKAGVSHISLLAFFT